LFLGSDRDRSVLVRSWSLRCGSIVIAPRGEGFSSAAVLARNPAAAAPPQGFAWLRADAPETTSPRSAAAVEVLRS